MQLLNLEPISKDEEGNEIITPRLNTIATKYYYRTKDNQIVEGDEYGNIDGRIYPVIQKYLKQNTYQTVSMMLFMNLQTLDMLTTLF